LDGDFHGLASGNPGLAHRFATAGMGQNSNRLAVGIRIGFPVWRIAPGLEGSPRNVVGSRRNSRVFCAGRLYRSAPVIYPLGIEIRSYANLDDAKSHGWEFSDPIARLDEQPVPSEASFRGASYAFDGLLPARLLGAVPKDMRVFGRLCYRLLVIQPASVPPTSMTATSLPQAPLPPATLNPAA
jgi:hypothetical protein